MKILVHYIDNNNTENVTTHIGVNCLKQLDRCLLRAVGVNRNNELKDAKVLQSLVELQTLVTILSGSINSFHITHSNLRHYHKTLMKLKGIMGLRLGSFTNKTRLFVSKHSACVFCFSLREPS